MEKERFIELLRNATADFGSAISTDDGDWVVKGFIDINKNIYTISSDTKIVSKLLELYLFPKIIDFAKRNNLKIELAKEQNYYPDITFIDADGAKFAVDIKSSYRKNSSKINGMTLGAFTGYFRNRESSKNMLRLVQLHDPCDRCRCTRPPQGWDCRGNQGFRGLGSWRLCSC
jgi:hypothetical protein